MSRFYKNWFFHNVIAHPASEILRRVGLGAIADAVHDGTAPLPEEGEGAVK